MDAVRFVGLDALNRILELEGMRMLEESEFENLSEDYNAFIVRVSREIGTNVDAIYGIKGKAAAWGDLTGGVGQIVTSLDGNTLKTLGMLKEE